MSLRCPAPDNGYRADRLYDISPFRVADVGFNAILQRAKSRSAVPARGHWRCRRRGGSRDDGTKDRGRHRAMLARGGRVFLWRRYANLGDDPQARDCRAVAAVRGCRADRAARRPRLVRRLENWLARVTYGVPSFEPGRPEFEPQRYWRGLVWLIVNWQYYLAVLPGRVRVPLQSTPHPARGIPYAARHRCPYRPSAYHALRSSQRTTPQHVELPDFRAQAFSCGFLVVSPPWNGDVSSRQFFLPL
jgi:hypothetical protein